MAARRGKSQARRNTGNSGGLPGWAWLVLGIVLTLIVILMAPKWLKSGGGDGFIRPKPNPDAQPAAVSASEDSVVQESDAPNTGAAATDAKPAQTGKDDKQQYDFYTLLPGQEVAMSDAELAASERAEEERQRKLTQQQQQKPQQQPQTAAANTLPAQLPEQTSAPATTAPAAAAAAASTTPAAASAPQVAAANTQARYILQAGAFGASGDAETLKARIAMLGLNARVESASIGGKTVYRVRMGPYGTATELAEAKRKLGSGGLPAMAVKAK